MIRAAGIEPVVVEYLRTPPSRETLTSIIKAIGGSVRALLREKGTPFAELGLDDPRWTDEELVGFIAQHPILLNRAIVVTDKGAALCRPSEKVLALLPESAALSFTKEDGEVVSGT